MDLKNFIKSSLVEIAQGITDANNQLAQGNSDQGQYILIAEKDRVDFDVAVTVTKSSSHGLDCNADGKIQVSMIGSGGLGALFRGEKSKANSTVSRIQFSVNVNKNLSRGETNS